MCGLFGLMAASAVVKYVQKQDIRADIVLLTMFIIWAIVVGSNTWVADIGAVVVGAVSGWAWLQTRWSSYRRQLGAGLAVLAVCLVALVVTWVMGGYPGSEIIGVHPAMGGPGPFSDDVN